MDPGSVKAGPPPQAMQQLARPEPVSGHRPVATTELSPLKTVLAPEATLAPKQPDRGPVERPRTREFTFDPQAGEMIFRVVDMNSGVVVRQSPDEAMLKLRAYRERIEQEARDTHRRVERSV